MQQDWTNCSVKALAGEGDPIQVLSRKIRDGLFDAMEHGYSGPPFDPIKLAYYLNISVLPSGSVRDARVMQDNSGKFCIEFNPSRPKSRINFSIAHEIAHTFFPDCGNSIRNRHSINTVQESEWELELLCNLGAAEILMPAGSFSNLKREAITIDNALKIRKEFNVSTEAVLRRLIQLTDEPFFAFAASATEQNNKQYKIDYFFGSKAIPFSVNRNTQIPLDSIILTCSAIGYTAQATERWSDYLPYMRIECVGLPPYPGKTMPRVVGIGRPNELIQSPKFARLRYITGDVLSPICNGACIIAHVVNDKANRWGGRGVANAVAKKWPPAFSDFSFWREEKRDNFSLGNAKLYEICENLFLFSMIAQHGYGVSEKPRIRYKALEQCFDELYEHAHALEASVHMPKIGTGYGQGDWDLISEMIETQLCQRGVETTIYSLPS